MDEEQQKVRSRKGRWCEGGTAEASSPRTDTKTLMAACRGNDKRNLYHQRFRKSSSERKTGMICYVKSDENE